MPKETMSPRERWLAVLEGAQPDRIPTDIWYTQEFLDRLLAYLHCDFEDMRARLHIDGTHELAGRYAGPPLPHGTDVWGITYRPMDYGSGVYNEAASHPLAQYDSVDAIEANYPWPNPDWWDYSHLAAEAAQHADRALRGGGTEPFLLYKHLRGETQAFLDLLEHPDITHYCIEKIVSIQWEATRRIFESVPGQVTLTYVAEDLGGQEGLMFSIDQIRTFILPYLARVIELARDHGVYVFFHSDGAIRAIIPDLIAAGIHVLNPIQWRCAGMDRERLKQDFGGHIAFHGAMDNQQTLPFGSVEDVRAEVLDNLRIFGADGRYFLAPCHNIQAITPPENVVAMYETAYAYGWR